jgi:phosphatidylglycerophosphatase A
MFSGRLSYCPGVSGEACDMQFNPYFTIKNLVYNSLILFGILFFLAVYS